MTDLRKLDAAATQGVWEAALERGCHGVIAVALPEGGANFVAMVGNDAATPEREPMRFANAEFIAALVNAYRAGKLVEAEAANKLRDTLKPFAKAGELFADQYPLGSPTWVSIYQCDAGEEYCLDSRHLVAALEAVR